MAHDDGPSLMVQIFQALEGSSFEEARFDRAKAAFVASFSIRMTDLMAEESKTITFGKRVHLRDDDRAAPGASQPSQIRVVDDALFSRKPPMHQGLVQKTLHRKPVEGTIEF